MNYRVIKEDDLFLLTDLSGDIPERQADGMGLGLYTKDTRFLSVLELRINGQKPVVLMSEADENYVSTILLTNPHMERDGEVVLWRESIEIERKRFIYQNVLYETIRTTNRSPYACSFDLSLRFDADFADMFAVRGFQHGKLGQRRDNRCTDDGLVAEYEGSDGIRRALKVAWSGAAARSGSDGTVSARIALDSGASAALTFTLMPIVDGAEPAVSDRDRALASLRSSYAEWEREATAVGSDCELFNRLYEQGLQDIRVLLTDLGFGRFPVAGLPWFAVPFGRDSLIAALQLLPVAPDVAAGTLRTLAHYQGRQEDAWRDEQPGKIMHELRNGELAHTNQVPFTPYYGTIDATPLFLVLLAEYVKWTDDTGLLRELQPNVEAALDWIDRYGDRDGSGLTAYYQESSKGIANQGWKDSADSIVHESGEYAQAPIKLVEVQGYVHLAKSGLAEVFRAAAGKEQAADGWLALAARLEAEAAQLRSRFESSFWMDDKQYYAIALDRENKPVRSVTSNPGHGLLSGLYAPERAAAVAERLVSPALFSGYGIRTMAQGEKGYNPMSYHDGSVWPHDNSLILLGLAKQGFRAEAKRVMEGLLQAARHFENGRLPELFCGYAADKGRPVRYPVACSPQAWAAATPLTFVAAIAGLQMDYGERTMRFRPVLPDGMTRLTVGGMRLGAGSVSLEVLRSGAACEVRILENTSGWRLQAASC